MEMKDKALKILAESVDLQKLATGILDEVLEEALKKVVADSSNPLDDMVMAAMWPVLEKEIKKLIAEKLDLVKLLKLDEQA